MESQEESADQLDERYRLRASQLTSLNSAKGNLIVRCHDEAEHEGRRDPEFALEGSVVAGLSDVFDSILDHRTPRTKVLVITERPVVLHVALCYMYTKHYPITSFDISVFKRFVPGSDQLFENMLVCDVELFEIGIRLKCRLLQEAAHIALVNAIMSTKRYTALTSQPRFRDVTAILPLIYNNEHSSEDMKMLVAWLSVKYINSRTIPRDVHELAPTLSSYHTRELQAIEELPDGQCHLCKKNISAADTKSVIVWEETGCFEWVHCACHFRGYCSTRCGMDDQTFPQIWYDYPCNSTRTYYDDPIEYTCQLVRKYSVLHRIEGEGKPCRPVLSNGTLKLEPA